MFPALRPILNKGGAGRYISRAESVERLMPIAQRHLDLLRTYTATLPLLPEGPALERIRAMMPYLRTEVSKVSETLLSLGGTPPNGIGETGEPLAGRSDAARVQALIDAEQGFAAALREEIDAVHHQERTRAIVGHNAEASDARIDVLRGVVAELAR